MIPEIVTIFQRLELELRITKVAISNVIIWIVAWTPYATVCMIGSFGDKSLVTPLTSQLPAFFAKLASALNPVVLAISHPNYRKALRNIFRAKATRENLEGEDIELNTQGDH